jgi:hypothetical protein
MSAEQFDINAYLWCDCAEHERQTCDKCAVRGHIASLTRELEEAREALRPFAECDVLLSTSHYNGESASQSYSVRTDKELTHEHFRRAHDVLSRSERDHAVEPRSELGVAEIDE